MTYRCPNCGGNGEIYFDDHHPLCNGDCAGCPVQGRDPCDVCNCTGSVTYEVLVETVSKWPTSPLEMSEMIQMAITEAEEANADQSKA